MSGKRQPPPPAADDQDELARALGDVQPLGGRERVPVREGAPVTERRAAITESEALEILADAERLEGRAPDLDTKTWRRLRRGDLPVEADLDLHGLRREDAERAVERFVRASTEQNRRVVRIVHGRGLHSAEGAVLRQQMSRWLRTGGAASVVRAFVTAPSRAGGDGAVLVLLRRR